MTDKDAWKEPLYETHGKAIVQQIINAKLATEAASQLVSSQSLQDAMIALQILVDLYNEVSTKYCHAMGWTNEDLLDVQAAIQLAWSARIVVPEGKAIVQLLN